MSIGTTPRRQPTLIGSFVFIEEQNPSGVGTITFSSLGAYTHLQIRLDARSTNAGTNADVQLRFNGDAGANYDRQYLLSSGGTAAGGELFTQTSGQIAQITAATGPANVSGSFVIDINNYRGTTFQKIAISSGFYKNTNVANGLVAEEFRVAWRNTAAITSITIFLSAGNYVAGSKFSLYGIL